MMMYVNLKFRILGLATCLGLQGCAGVLDLDDALAIAPYRIEDSGRIVVEAHVNDQGPYDFVLDTAASISAVFDHPRKELVLEPIPGMFVLVHGVVGSGKHALLNIERLAVGSEIWASPRIVSLPGETDAGTSLDGVLGVDFLRQYAVGFSTRDRVIRLYPPDLVAQRAYRGWASVPLKVRPIANGGPTVYFIDVEIEGWQITGVFDLGAGFNMINTPGVRSLGVTPRKLRRAALLSGALESSPIAAWLEADEVTTARIRWQNEEFSIADIDIFDTFMLSDRPAAILGAGLFTQRDFVIDFARSRLLVNVAMDEVDETP